MKRLSILTCTMIALGFMAITVWAQNAHFMRCSSSVNSTTGCISASFRIAGLGNGASATITATSTVTATWGCLNGGQQCPNAANKFTTTEPISGSVDVTAGHNGVATGTINLCPTRPANFCPNGQTMELISATYSDVVLTNSVTDDNTCTTSGGSASFFPQCP